MNYTVKTITFKSEPIPKLILFDQYCLEDLPEPLYDRTRQSQYAINN